MYRLDPDRLDPVSTDDLAAAYAFPPGTGPYVRAVMISALDGSATLRGRSAGLGNPADVALFALFRDLADVILVGSGTVRAEGYGGVHLADDHGDIRRSLGFDGPPPIAVVSTGSLTGREALFTDTETPPIVVTTAAGARRMAGIDADFVVAGDGELDIPHAIGQLADRGLRRINCEGGPRLLGSLLATGSLDELCLTISPMVVGEGPKLTGSAATAVRRFSLATLHRDGEHLFARYLRSGTE